MQLRRPRLWFLPPLETLGSFRVGFAVALGLMAVNLTAALVLGGATPLKIRFAINFALGVGYALGVAPAVLARLPKEIDGLEGVDRLGAGGQVLASALGVAIAAILFTLSPMSKDALRWVLEVESLLLWILNVPIGFVLIRALWRLRRLGGVAPVNLLEPRPLAAFGRAAALIALYVAGGFVIFTLVTIVGRPGGARAELPSVIYLTLFLAAALYLPLSGARRGIRAAKQAELDRIAADLGDHHDVLAGADGPDRVDRLMAYRERIRAVPEWPFGVGTAPRALLYVALPLLSWIAAALVERSMEVVLD